MMIYKNISGDSPIVKYEIDDESITVLFRKTSGLGTFYKYTNASAGPSNISEMKEFAEAGRGLAAFISQNRPPYDSKWSE